YRRRRGGQGGGRSRKGSAYRWEQVDPCPLEGLCHRRLTGRMCEIGQSRGVTLSVRRIHVRACELSFGTWLVLVVPPAALYSSEQLRGPYRDGGGRPYHLSAERFRTIVYRKGGFGERRSRGRAGDLVLRHCYIACRTQTGTEN